MKKNRNYYDHTKRPFSKEEWKIAFIFLIIFLVGIGAFILALLQV